jgi:hypothetical protein
MIIFHRLKSFARWVFRRGEVERQLHDELESFIELTARDKIRDGVAPDEARRLARLELRGIDQTKERVRWYRWGAATRCAFTGPSLWLAIADPAAWLYCNRCGDAGRGNRREYRRL